MISYVLVWGGGDLGSGVALQFFQVGIRVLVVETHEPLAVRLSVSFAQTVYDGKTQVEGIEARLIETPHEMAVIWEEEKLPVLVDPDLDVLNYHPPLVLVDARMKKTSSLLALDTVEMVIGLGLGFIVGQNCHAAVETNRGHCLGRVYWEGSPEADTGIPGMVEKFTNERVLYAPVDGVIKSMVAIGDLVEVGDVVLSVGQHSIRSPLSGLVRGLIHDGIHVHAGMKVGDVDPRPQIYRCKYISEKSRAIGCSVLSAALKREDIRNQLWRH